MLGTNVVLIKYIYIKKTKWQQGSLGSLCKGFPGPFSLHPLTEQHLRMIVLLNILNQQQYCLVVDGQT